MMNADPPNIKALAVRLHVLQVEAVDVTVNDEAGHEVVRQLLAGPDPRGRDVRFIVLELEADRAGPEGRRDQVIRLLVERKRRVLVVSFGPAMFPEKPAGPGVVMRGQDK